MDAEGWVEPMSRKKKRKMRATVPEKETLEQHSRRPEEGTEKGVTGPLAGDKTLIFPLDGEASQQLLVQALVTLLQQAGIGQ